jgi:hypothetical protein
MEKLISGLASGFAGHAMSEPLTMEDWKALWRRKLDELELRYWQVDERAGFSDGYMAKVMCGQVKAPTWPTILKINRVLRIVMVTLDRNALEGVGDTT